MHFLQVIILILIDVSLLSFGVYCLWMAYQNHLTPNRDTDLRIAHIRSSSQRKTLEKNAYDFRVRSRSTEAYYKRILQEEEYDKKEKERLHDIMQKKQEQLIKKRIEAWKRGEPNINPEPNPQWKQQYNARWGSNPNPDV